MWGAVFLVAVSSSMSSMAWSRSPSYVLPVVDDSSYSYGSYYRPFEVPGEISEGVTVSNLLRIAGDLWFARSVGEGIRITCGPLSEVTGTDTCALLESNDCRGLWDFLVTHLSVRDDLDGSFGLVPGLQCLDWYDGDSLSYSFDYGYDAFQSIWNISEFDISKKSSKPLSPADFINPYDPCSKSGIEKANNIVFAMLDWLGPSVLDTKSYNTLDQSHSICSIVRYLLSTNTKDVYENVIDVLKLILADIFEALQPLNVCALIDESELNDLETDVVGVSKTLLAELSDMSEDELCRFLAEEQTRDEYLETAKTVLSNALFMLHDKETCNNVLEIVAPLDRHHFLYTITGFKLWVKSERNEFCSEAEQAYSASSPYVPKPYQLPPGVDLKKVTPFEVEGEFLPGLTFVDLMRIEGAAFNSDKLVDSVALTCTVFGDFAASVMGKPDDFDVEGLCRLAGNRELEALEDLCVAEYSASDDQKYYPDRPVGLRLFNPVSVAIFASHEIFGINDISKDEICPAADAALKDSVETVLLEFATIFITEILPSADGFCEHWDEVMCYLKPYCPLPGPTTNPPENSWYTQSVLVPEYMEQDNAAFDEAVSKLTYFISMATGFDGREEACAFIASAIDPLSGRGDKEAALILRDRIFEIIYDADQCSLLLEAGLSLVGEKDVEYILTGGNTNLVYQLTGYQTSEEFCQEVERAFTVNTAGGGRLTYKLLADVTLQQLKRAARFSKYPAV